MKSWGSSWAAAQTTGVVFSSLVWIVVWGLSFPALVMTVAVGIALAVGRNSRPMLWWRFGATPANDFERDTALAAIVPVPSLRGRHQPSVWIGRRLFGAEVVMPSSALLVVSPQFVGRLASGKPMDRQVSAMISQALRAVQVVDPALVSVLEAFCMPWRLVQVLITMVSQFAARHRTLRFSWGIRWIVFGVAIVDNYLNARWTAFIGVILIAVLSWTTGHFQRRWDRWCQDLGDQGAIAEASAPTLPTSSSTETLQPPENAPTGPVTARQVLTTGASDRTPGGAAVRRASRPSRTPKLHGKV